MLPGIRNEHVYLSICPTPVDSLANNRSITTGDLHANLMRLIFFLTRENIFRISLRDYKTLDHIYLNRGSKPSQSDIIHVLDIFQRTELNPEAKSVLIRLLGDTVCDRGENDLWIFELLDCLKQKGLKIKILFSNHDSSLLVDQERVKPDLMSFDFNYQDHTQSYTNFGNSITTNIISKERANYLIESFKENLVLFDYEICEKDGRPHLQFFAHSLVGLETLAAVAEYYHIKYDEKKLTDVCRAIDEINILFKKDVKNKQISRLLSMRLSDASEIYLGREEISTRTPFMRAIWNRVLCKDAIEHIRTPTVWYDYDMTIVHGHVGEMPTPHSSGVNLDTDVGKSKFDNNGKYAVFHSLSSDKLECKSVPEPVAIPVLPNGAVAVREAAYATSFIHQHTAVAVLSIRAHNIKPIQLPKKNIERQRSGCGACWFSEEKKARKVVAKVNGDSTPLRRLG